MAVFFGKSYFLHLLSHDTQKRSTSATSTLFINNMIGNDVDLIANPSFGAAYAMKKKNKKTIPN